MAVIPKWSHAQGPVLTLTDSFLTSDSEPSVPPTPKSVASSLRGVPSRRAAASHDRPSPSRRSPSRTQPPPRAPRAPNPPPRPSPRPSKPCGHPKTAARASPAAAASRPAPPRPASAGARAQAGHGARRTATPEAPRVPIGSHGGAAAAEGRGGGGHLEHKLLALENKVALLLSDVLSGVEALEERIDAPRRAHADGGGVHHHTHHHTHERPAPAGEVATQTESTAPPPPPVAPPQATPAEAPPPPHDDRGGGAPWSYVCPPPHGQPFAAYLLPAPPYDYPSYPPLSPYPPYPPYPPYHYACGGTPPQHAAAWGPACALPMSACYPQAGQPAAPSARACAPPVWLAWPPPHPPRRASAGGGVPAGGVKCVSACLPPWDARCLGQMAQAEIPGPGRYDPAPIPRRSFNINFSTRPELLGAVAPVKRT